MNTRRRQPAQTGKCHPSIPDSLCLSPLQQNHARSGCARVSTRVSARVSARVKVSCAPTSSLFLQWLTGHQFTLVLVLHPEKTNCWLIESLSLQTCRSSPARQSQSAADAHLPGNRHPSISLTAGRRHTPKDKARWSVARFGLTGKPHPGWRQRSPSKAHANVRHSHQRRVRARNCEVKRSMSH